MSKKSKWGGILFLLFILILIAGGQYLYMQVSKEDEDVKVKDNKKINYKIDNKKDFIYYKNESVISEKAEIFYRDVVINIKGQEHITNALNAENSIYKSNIKYISKQEILSEEMIHYRADDIYMLTYREYKTYSFDNYVSLVVFDYTYDCFDGSVIKEVKSYVFDTSTGKELSTNDLLDKYNTNIDSIKENIKLNLISKQQVVDGVDLIKTDETINSITEPVLYINDVGKLVVDYLVKTTQTDYNEIMNID